MKLALPFLSVFFSFFINISFAQESGNYFESEQDKNYLRNYKAPDFKFRRLQFSFDGLSSGIETETDVARLTRAIGGLEYYVVSNRTNFQGNNSTGLATNFNFTKVNGVIATTFTASANNSTQNRFYFKEKWFLGFHNMANLSTSSFTNSNPLSPDFTNLSISVRPAFSIGFGRLERVYFGRQAMDIEKMLMQGGRLNKNLSEENRTLLADKIAEVQNKRFYDTRLGRIYQLEALDTVLRSMNVISDYDFAYFSQLQDAFLYSNFFSRLSGTRHEFGLAEGFDFGESGGTISQTDFMSYAFYSFSYYLPQSYSVQHNLRASIIGGLNVQGSPPTITRTTPVWLDGSYTFGLYPTTRTYIGASANVGFNYSNNILGYLTGTSFDAYYYISPKFRFWSDLNFNFGENYTAHNFNHVAVFNSSRGVRQIDYSFKVGLTYAIF